MLSRIFYSWQSDLESRLGRGFVRSALDAAAEACGARLEVEDSARGGPGSPMLAEAILEKIAHADVLVSDVTPVAQTSSGKVVPNPNVMLELGYGLANLGGDRVVMLANAIFLPQDGIGGLPFDLRHRGVLTYRAGPADSLRKRRTECARLAVELGGKLSVTLKSADRDMSE